MALQFVTNIPSNGSLLNYSLPTPHGRPWVLLTPHIQNLENTTVEDAFRKMKDSAEQIQQLGDPIIKDAAAKPLEEIIFSLVLSHMHLPEPHMTSPKDSLRFLYNYCGPFNETLFIDDPKEHTKQRLDVLHHTRSEVFDLTFFEIEKMTGKTLSLPERHIPYGLSKEEFLCLLKLLFMHKFPLHVLYRESNNPVFPLTLSPFEYLFTLLEDLEARSVPVRRYVCCPRTPKDFRLLPSSYSPVEIRLLEKCIRFAKQAPYTIYQK